MTKTTRRTKGEGSIYLDKNRKLWIAQLTLGISEKGKRVRKTISGKTKVEVVNKMKKYLKEDDTSVVPSSAKNDAPIDFCEYAKYFLNTYKRPAVKSSTFAWYCHMHKHIEKEFKGFDLKDVSHIKVQNFLNSIARTSAKRKAMSQSCIKGFALLFKQIFKQALREELISYNPFDKGVVIPKSDKQTKEVKPLSKEICRQILKASETSKVYKPLIYTLLFTGMRVGEVMALKWENIDKKKGIIYVREGMSRQNVIDEDLNIIERRSAVSSTKTFNSVRPITVGKEVFEALDEWREYFVHNTVYKDSPDNKYVFLTKQGTLRDYNCFKRQFKNFLTRKGFDGDHINFHQFRHTYATLLIDNGENPRVVQELLGHKDVQTTLNIYTSVSIQSLKRATSGYANLFKEA